MDFEKNAITHLLTPLTCWIRDNKKPNNINDFESYLAIIRKLNEMGEDVKYDKLHRYAFKKVFEILQLKWTDPIQVTEKVDEFLRKHLDPKLQFYYWAYRNRYYFNDDCLNEEIKMRKVFYGKGTNLPGMQTTD